MSRVNAGIPGNETETARDALVDLGKARHIRDQEWLDGLHRRRLRENPDSLHEYTKWQLTDKEWARAKRTDPNLSHHMQVEHRIAQLQKQANGDQKLFSTLWQEELAAMRRRDQQERAEEESKNRALPTPFNDEERQKRQQMQAGDPAPLEQQPTMLDDIFLFLDTLAKETRAMLEKLTDTPDAKN